MLKRLEVKNNGILDIIERILILIITVSATLIIPYKSSHNHMVTKTLVIILIVSFIVLVILIQFLYDYKFYTNNECLFIEKQCFLISDTSYWIVGRNIILYEGERTLILKKDKKIISFFEKLGISEEK